MADPFSIIALISTSIKSIIAAKDFIESVQRVPRSIEALSDELSAIEGLLRELGYLAKGNDDSRNLDRILRQPLANCGKISKKVDSLIRPYVKSSGSGITVWSRLKFSFKESDVRELERDMSTCKQNLIIAIASADLLTTKKVARGIKRVQNHFAIASSSVTESEMGEETHEHIAEWMSRTEMIIEEVEEAPNPAPKHSQATIPPTVVSKSPWIMGDAWRFSQEPMIPAPEIITGNYLTESTSALPPLSSPLVPDNSAKEPTETLLPYLNIYVFIVESWFEIGGEAISTRKRHEVLLWSGLKDSILDLKIRMSRWGGGPPSDLQQLVHDQKEMENHLTLLDYNVQDHDEVYLVKRKMDYSGDKSTMKLFLKLFGGSPEAKWSLDVSRSSNTKDLCRQIWEEKGPAYPQHKIRLYYEGYQMGGPMSLLHAGISDRDTIDLVLKG